jgi:hypothetical protein
MRLLFPIRPHVNALAATLAADRTPGRVLELHPITSQRVRALPLTARRDSYLADKPFCTPIETDFTRLASKHGIRHSAANATTLGLFHRWTACFGPS